MARPPSQVDAGFFGEWLAVMRGVLRGEGDADVPCGDCIGCCISSYPVPLRPRDEAARAEVPEQWLIGPASPGEKWLMGFREDGSCPFMEDRTCAIYDRRPQCCRDYDCRVYAAAGLVPDGNRSAIEQRVRAWEFRYASDAERAEAGALRQAAQFIRGHQALFPAGMRAGAATAAAVLAVKTYDLFLSGDAGAVTPEEMVRRVIQAARDFDAGPAGSSPA